MKVLIVIGAALILSTYSCNAMSEKQMKAAVKLVRNTCQPKTKATNEDIDGMHQGKWDVDKTAKCFLFCVLNLYKMITKENTLNFDEGMKQLHQLPEHLRAPSEEALNICKDSAKTKNDKCEASYEICHCLYQTNPEKYFLP